MHIPLRLRQGLKSFMSDKSKGPWGGPGEDKDDGPKNPWTIPPTGRRAKTPTALDDWLKRARGGGGGGNGGGNFSLPSGPGGKSLWMIGIGLVVVAWVGFTSIHPIGPQERGVTTFFGRYYDTLGPGIHLTFPAPINRVIPIDVQNIRTEDFPDGGDGENLMITGDQNIIDLAYSVRWNVSNPQDFEFQIADPRSTVRSTAESAMREVVANVDLDSAMGPGRTIIEQQVQDRMQRILDSYRAGVLIQGVAIKQADPPAQVNEAFKSVTAAQQNAVAAKNKAQAFAQQVIAQAQGEAAQFDRMYQQYKLAPEVTKRRMYYETMENILARTDKVVVDAPGVLPYLKLQGGRSLPPPDDSDVQATAPAPAPTAEAGQ
ncbi:protease modulator HflK [Sphingomonas koreensis]|nr:protease modulator HflK [Sphingomonas koreensis]